MTGLLDKKNCGIPENDLRRCIEIKMLPKLDEETVDEGWEFEDEQELLEDNIVRQYKSGLRVSIVMLSKKLKK